jgi:hypothetical protein
VKRIEGILGLVVVLEFDEAVAFRHFAIKVERYDYLDYVSEAAKLIFQVFLP